MARLAGFHLPTRLINHLTVLLHFLFHPTLKRPKVNVEHALALPRSLKEQERLRQRGVALRQKELAIRERNDLRMFLHQAARRRNELVAEKDELSSHLEEELDIAVKGNTRLFENLHVLLRRNDVPEREKEVLAGRLPMIFWRERAWPEKRMEDIHDVSSQGENTDWRTFNSPGVFKMLTHNQTSSSRSVAIASQRDVIATQRS
ncbi:hypothetical protein ONZ45_g11998 [Pleurotus djamor]|nr:hypothetical protein ONZ45_g11998 [Pleurotus djamor]